MVSLLWSAGLAFAGPVAPPDPGVEGSGATYDPRVSVAPLVEAVDPAVVTIEITGDGDGDRVPPGLRELFGLDRHRSTRPDGLGSGFIIDESGLVLTNHHVVDDARGIRAVLNDGSEITAHVLGSDADLDIALLQLEGEAGRAWPWVALADSSEVRVGDWVVVMGNALDLGTTATIGIVSGKGRVLHHDRFGQDDFIQTDAAINQGNSGGPMFDLQGRVIGMNTAIIAGANTVGFAISSNLITRVLEDLKTRGRVARGYLGVAPQTLDAELRAALKIDAAEGALIAQVIDNTPAARSGLKTGDVVVEVDGSPIASDDELVAAIAGKRPGDEVRLQVERNRKRQSIEVTLTERPGPPSPVIDDAPRRDPAISDAPGDAGALSRLGLDLRELPADIADRAGVQRGVLVHSVQPSSPAHGRLLPGDIIVEVDRKGVDSVAKAERMLSRADEHAYLLIVRDDAQQFVALPLE